jgi:putative ABC transport system permease protein
MTALDRKLLRDLKRLWSQALTLALVVAAAVAGFITTYSAYDSLQYSRDRYYAVGQFADLFADLKRAPDRVMQQLAQVPGIASLEATVVRDVQVSIPGVSDPIIGKLIGLDPKHPPQINRVFLRSGRMISSQSSGPREVLISEAFAIARGLQPGDHLFALINGKRERLLVAGIALSPEFIFAGFSGAPDLKGYGVFWLDKKALASAYQMDGAFNHVNLRLAPGAKQDEAIAGIDHVLQPWGGIRAYGRDEQLSYTRVESEIKEQRVLGTLLPAIFLAIAAFLLNVVLGRQILMQREQIAALKALGYDNALIGWHYIKLALLIVAVGVALGMVTGAWLGEMLTTLYRKSFSFPEFYFRVRPSLLLIALFTTVSAALAATWQAIKSSVQLAPAEAMRPRAPGVYRPTIIEVLGWREAFSPSMRMVFRNMQRSSIRAGLTVLGVAASIAVLIGGTFWGDAIELLLNTQFRQVLRADISVGLIEPRNITALHALARLPYVSAVEPGRSVPVRLVHEHRRWRGVIQGRPSIPQLHRVVGLDKRAMPIPTDGLLLTDRLARKLGLRVGDMVTVEVEEGQRATLILPVVAVVSELMGMSAYIERRSLNHLLREGDVLNRATLLVDRGHEAELLQRMQQIPMVAAAFSKASMLANVQGITARNLRIITGVLTIFASIIAVGVVYNQVRVALAERAWELASLRVLGFTRAEVSKILLGEIVLEIALAIPIGMLGGLALAKGMVALIATDEFFLPAQVQTSTYAYAVLCVVITGVISAAIVNRKIRELDLVGVLKTHE